MPRPWTEHSDRYLRLFADCMPVRGAVRSAIYDLTRHEIITFPSDYFELLMELNGISVTALIELVEKREGGELIEQFVDFLEENQFLMVVDDPSLFPELPETWDYPGTIQNAVIDVMTVCHDFERIFSELDSLACQHVQIRSFSSALSLERCSSILVHALHKSIAGVEVLLQYQEGIENSEYTKFVRENPIVTQLTVHSANISDTFPVDDIIEAQKVGYPHRNVRFITDQISSEKHCGKITQRHLTLPAVGPFFEARHFNGCLNRKISIDSQGTVRNCPSMAATYGNISDTTLQEVANTASFREVWGLNKDQIAICKDCEFRYACSDCRAYLEDPTDLYSKPLKCGYDPYSASWTEWTSHSSKRATAHRYGMDALVQIQSRR